MHLFCFIRNFVSLKQKRSAWMHRGAYNEDVATQSRPAREFASKLFVRALIRMRGIYYIGGVFRNVFDGSIYAICQSKSER